MCNIKQWEIYYVDLGNVVGSEQGGIRPCLIVQNDIGNKFSTTTIICPITSQTKGFNKTHLDIDGLLRKSTVLFEQVRTVDKKRINTNEYVGKLSPKEIEMGSKLLMTTFGI